MSREMITRTFTIYSYDVKYVRVATDEIVHSRVELYGKQKKEVEAIQSAIPHGCQYLGHLFIGTRKKRLGMPDYDFIRSAVELELLPRDRPVGNEDPDSN